MTAPPVASTVADYFREHAGRFGLNAGAIDARYILNWGGFVNYSFTVSDGGARRLHCKLAHRGEEAAGLLQWRAHHAHLEARYRAPSMLGWVDLPDQPFSGPVFAHIDGYPPDLAGSDAAQLAEVGALIGALHQDHAFAEALGIPPGRRCRDTFVETFIRRWYEDLNLIAAERPGFVGDGTLTWMEQEARRLEADVEASPDFDCAATVPIHGDLWGHNLLVAGAGDWYLLDWDDLQVGDPVLDLALLGWSAGVREAAGGRTLALTPAGEEATARLPLYVRACLLDEVIDTVADVVEAAAAAGHGSGLIAEKQVVHLRALDRYRATYTDAPHSLSG